MITTTPVLLIVGASVLMLGCRKTELFATTAESYSPTGDWLVTAHSRPGSAFGGGYFLTDVDLKRPSSAVPTQIVEFSHEQPTMGLVMEWTTPKHLLVKYQNAGLVSHVNSKQRWVALIFLPSGRIASVRVPTCLRKCRGRSWPSLCRFHQRLRGCAPRRSPRRVLRG